MMTKKFRQSGKSSPLPRTFNLHARFTPEGTDAEDRRAFSEFWVEATAHAQKLKSRALEREKADFEQLVGADRKTRSILFKALRNELPADVAAQRIRRKVRDEKLLRQLFDHWQEVVSITTEQLEKRKKQIDRDGIELQRREKLNKAFEAIANGMQVLAEESLAGDADAAKELVEAAMWVCSWVSLAERAQPEMFGALARGQMQWPILARDEEGWERDAIRRIEKLSLGMDLRVLKTRFRKARGTDVNLPARLWAKAAVRVVEESRWRSLMFSRLVRDSTTVEALAEFCIAANWQSGRHAQWTDDMVKLIKFDRASLPNWKQVIRRMIREEMPDFHLRPEWTNQRNTAAMSGRDAAGEIRNAILDDIVSALTRLVPE